MLVMRTILFHPTRFILLSWLLIGSFFLFACAPQESVRIIITPTPRPNQTGVEGVIPTVTVPTLEPSATATATLTEIPTEIVTLPTMTLEATQAASGVSGVTETPDMTDFGPIIDSNYVLPPTSTTRPTETPTLTLSPTSPGTPIATPLTTLPQLDGSRMGVQLYWNLDIDTWYIMLQRAKAMNVGWIKMQADWAFLQPNNPDEYEQTFRLFAGHVQQAKNLGFRVLISVAKAPAWARNVDRTDSGPPDDPQALATFLRLMIAQVKPENIDAYEIWNEPNLIREWHGALPFNGAGYMQLFVPAHAAIRQLDPEAVIVTAGLAPTGTLDGSVDDRDYLRQMYAAGLAQYTDVVLGIHPYSWGNPPDFVCCNTIPERGWDDDPHFFFADTLREYRDIMLQNGHGIQMWATEFGWSTWEGYPTAPPELWVGYNTAQDQLNYTVRAFEIAQASEYIGLMFLWNFNFGGSDLIQNRVELAGYSLFFDPGGAPQQRPLYDVLTQITTP